MVKLGDFLLGVAEHTDFLNCDTSRWQQAGWLPQWESTLFLWTWMFLIPVGKGLKDGKNEYWAHPDVVVLLLWLPFRHLAYRVTFSTVHLVILDKFYKISNTVCLHFILKGFLFGGMRWRRKVEIKMVKKYNWKWENFRGQQEEFRFIYIDFLTDPVWLKVCIFRNINPLLQSFWKAVKSMFLDLY